MCLWEGFDPTSLCEYVLVVVTAQYQEIIAANSQSLRVQPEDKDCSQQ